ncbi:MAG TPA: cytochrome b/b6 domain-containing protein [Burkholderiaceae bacterium]|jgi:cytochrome b561|nr:cytochrome b/b6 domain-containing protein [Burkholderiaceae bacterium]
MKYTLATRILHAIIAAGVACQLSLSLVMQLPEPGHARTALESLSFEIHENLGLILLIALVSHWLLFVFGHAHRGIGHFFPWFSRERMREVASEVSEFRHFRLGDPTTQDHLAGAIQGIGLCIASLLAATGTTLYFGIDQDGNMSPAVDLIKDVHTSLGSAMWTYLVLHAGATMAHTALGHRSVLSIFRLVPQPGQEQLRKDR